MPAPSAAYASERATSQAPTRGVEENMRQMREILDKLNIGMATRDEKRRLKSLDAKLDRMKSEVKRSVTRGDADVEALRASVGAKRLSLARSVKEKQVKNVFGAVCATESVDLAFIIDCAYSMKPYIDSVKSNIKKIVSDVLHTNSKLQLRLAVVGYRDLSDGDKRFEVMDFVSSVSTFETFVGNVKAVGGGDHPEDSAGSIQYANGLSWSHPTRLALLIADCPCHGTEFHDFEDSYPSGTPASDLQGVRDGNEFYLTDPAVLCSDIMRFG